jgi:GGDEF domain-containing protein
MLITIAQRLARTLRETDNVARLGGDEFVFLLKTPVTNTSLISS